MADSLRSVPSNKIQARVIIMQTASVQHCLGRQCLSSNVITCISCSWSMDSMISFICDLVSVHTIKRKWRKQSTPQWVDSQCMTLTLRSRINGEFCKVIMCKLWVQLITVGHGMCKGYSCRYDCSGFRVAIGLEVSLNPRHANRWILCICLITLPMAPINCPYSIFTLINCACKYLALAT